MGAVVNKGINLPDNINNYAWQNKGNCLNKDVEIFFHDFNERGEEREERIRNAKKICEGCPVINECLDHALSVPEHYGVWGGMSEDERRLIRRRRQRQARQNYGR